MMCKDLDFVEESYRVDRNKKRIVRTVRTPDGRSTRSSVPLVREMLGSDPKAAYDAEWLRLPRPPRSGRAQGDVRMVDLFCGLGGMSIGLAEACRALGLSMRHAWAADTNPAARKSYELRYPGVQVDDEPIESWLDGELGEETLTEREQELRDRLGEVSIALGGPPCQGHSDLNNHTRRRDPKNALYLKMARFAEVVRPRHLIIENVPGIRHDTAGVMAEARENLESNGYTTDAAVIRAEALGVPQTRHRMFVVASLRQDDRDTMDLLRMLECHSVDQRNFDWACHDLLEDRDRPFDRASSPKPWTKKRIEWLHRNGSHDLSDSMRPDCHRLKSHRYQAVYGRMHHDRPSPTITTGFLVMGQGRFVHPHQPRTMTPHEAARLQFLPDWSGLPDDLSRTDYATLIGNAVPPKLTYVLGLELLGTRGS